MLSLNNAYVLLEADVLPPVVELPRGRVGVARVAACNLDVDAVGSDEEAVSSAVGKVVDVGLGPGDPGRCCSSGEVAIPVLVVVAEDGRLGVVGLGRPEVSSRDPYRDAVRFITIGWFEERIEEAVKPTYS